MASKSEEARKLFVRGMPNTEGRTFNEMRKRRLLRAEDAIVF